MTYSRWASKDEIIKYTTQISYDSNIEKSGIEFMYDEKHLYIYDKESHNLIIGSTGSGKTQTTALPQIKLAIKAGESIIVNDIKGEIYNLVSGELKKQGYNIYVIDLINANKGNNYNPLYYPYKLYKAGDKDRALEMIENIGYYIFVPDTPNSEDTFWSNAAINLFTGIALYLFENAKQKEINLKSISILANEGEKLGKYIKGLDKSSLIYTYLSGIFLSPNETKGSILALFKQRIKPYSVKEGLSKVLCNNNIELENIQKEKTALFIMNENKSPSRELVSLIIDQCNFIENINPYTSRRLNVFIDDFEKIKAIKDFVNILNYSRGNNVKYNIYVKSLLELDNTYGKQISDLIKMNFGNIIYLLANDIDTLQQISKLCGRSSENTYLISEEKLKTMEYFEAIIIASRMYPIKTKLLPDYQIDWKFETKPFEQPNLEYNTVELYQI